MVKRIAPQVNSYCTYCKAEGREKVKARWRIPFADRHRACDEHKPALEALEAKERDDNHYTEADHQTWLKL